MGWRALVTALLAAADRWSVGEVKRLLKKFFDPSEFAILWHRMSRATETRAQLETRPQAQEEGLLLPKGDQGKYIKWLKKTIDAAEHAKMMILLQRTQELDINEWRTIREHYKGLLKQREEQIPEIPRGSVPTFTRKKIMFGALMEGKHEITPEWQAELKDIYESIRRNEDPRHVLQRITSITEGQMKMKLIRRTIQRGNIEWSRERQKTIQDLGMRGFEWQTNDDPGYYSEADQWFWQIQDEITKRRRTGRSIQEQMEVLPDLIARWDWYTRMKEESKTPVLEQWAKIKPTQWKLGI
jgi:hypothetical protein